MTSRQIWITTLMAALLAASCGDDDTTPAPDAGHTTADGATPVADSAPLQKDKGVPPPKKDKGAPPKKDKGAPPPKKDKGAPPPSGFTLKGSVDFGLLVGCTCSCCQRSMASYTRRPVGVDRVGVRPAAEAAPRAEAVSPTPPTAPGSQARVRVRVRASRNN